MQLGFLNLPNRTDSMPNREVFPIVRTFQSSATCLKIFASWKMKHQTSNMIKEFLIHKLNYYYFLLKEHGVNAAKWVSQAFKNNFDSGQWFMLKWIKLPFGTIGPTTSSSRLSQHDPYNLRWSSKSAYEIFHRKHNLNAQPWLPHGYNIIAHDTNNSLHHSSQEYWWMVHRYIKRPLPMLPHVYHGCQEYQICKGVTFLPKFCTIPKFSTLDYNVQIAEE